MFEVDDITISGQFIVAANPSGIGPSIPVTGISGISGAHHASSASLLGDPLSFPLPIANVMISGSSDLKLKAAPMLWIRSSPTSPVLPQNIILGDILGPVGIVAQTLITTWVNETTFSLVSPELSVVASTIGIGALSWTGSEIHIGTQENAGAKSDVGARVEASTASELTDLFVAGPCTAIDFFTVSGTLNEALATARSALALAGKGFDIPHPTKQNHRLRYICLEGPEVGAYIRGTLKDSDTINLPDYWRKLCKLETITVNLTPIGRYQELYVEGIIDWGTKIKIKNASGSSVHCHYTVFAERITHDQLQVEYKGLTPDDYPGDNSEYALGGWDYARHKGESKTSNL